MQLLAAGLEPYISLNGDERVTSERNSNYSECQRASKLGVEKHFRTPFSNTVCALISLVAAYYDGTLSCGRQGANLLTEAGYTIILFIEGRKLQKTLGAGKGGDNPAARKILKYMKVGA